MRVLVACEFSGRVRDQFISQGHQAVSCDLLPAEGENTESHYQGEVGDIIMDGWDMMIAFPPCTYLCSSGLHWNRRVDGRQANIRRIALENPVGCISTRIRPPDQTIHPYQFGDDASKRTCLWLRGLPKLRPTAYVEPRWVGTRPRWANQTDSGQNRLAPSPTRAKQRSTTYPGIAQAMARQWG